jgi:hypothetical protein
VVYILFLEAEMKKHINQISSFTCILFFFTVSINLFSQPIYTQKDVDVCKSKFNLIIDQKLSTEPISDIIIAIGKSFIGTDYEAHTLEKGDKENLVVNLTGLDCYTFLESTLALSRCVKKNKTDFNNYLKELETIRYRNGKLKDYTSRLHYFSDWIYDINKREIGRDITKEIGGIPYNLKLNFMSTHVDVYKQLKENNSFVKKIKKIENEINSRKYFYIPKENLEKYEDKIQDGDILGITTSIEGLDISHTGIACRADDGRIHLLHAPNIGYKVQISEKPLADYLIGNKKQTGIIILRPN